MRAAVIGAGQIAKQHLAALAATKGVQTVGVCDLSPVMAESTADRFGIAQWFTDFREMVEQQRPGVVHIATPPASHCQLARECLLAGCHVLVEKPITTTFSEFDELKTLAHEKGLWLVEDYNYLFNDSVQEILGLVASGELGDVRHVDVQICLDVFAPGSRFSDHDMPHPAMQEPMGVVADFLTHLCYLAYVFVGRHKRLAAFFNRRLPISGNPITEFQSLIDAERGTALLGLSASSQPDSFILKVQGTRMQIETNLFEVGAVRTETLGGPQPLVPIRNARRRARREKRNASKSLWRKLSGGPGPYEGLWRLVSLVYAGLENGGAPPISIDEIDAVNRLAQDIQKEVNLPCVS